jgi:hypothetical protein
MNDGTIEAIRGSVLDVVFEEHALPAINEALEVDGVSGRRLVADSSAAPPSATGAFLFSRASAQRTKAARSVSSPVMHPS